MPSLVLVRDEWRVVGTALGSVVLVQNSVRAGGAKALVELGRGADTDTPPATGVYGVELEPGEEYGAAALQAYTAHTSGVLFARAINTGQPGRASAILIISPEAQAPAYMLVPQSAFTAMVGSITVGGSVYLELDIEVEQDSACALTGAVSVSAGDLEQDTGLSGSVAPALVLTPAGDTVYELEA